MRVRGSAHLCVLCSAVIRAKVVSEKEVGSGNDVYGNPIKRIQYEIKQIKVRGGKGVGGRGAAEGGWPE